MDPSVSTDGEQKERKKIHFAVPASASASPSLDPRQVEMIRRRRPTPATLFRVADQPSPEDDQSSHQVKWVVGENGILKPKRVSTNVYQPPSLKAVQKMAEAHMQNLGVYPPLEDPCEGEEFEDQWQREEGEETSPTKAADHQPASVTEKSVKFSSVKEKKKVHMAEPEPEEEEEEDDEEEQGRTAETTGENGRGSN